MKIDIIKAEYGAGNKWKDVAKTLQDRVGVLPIVPLPLPQYNSSFGGDPAPGISKTPKIQYRIDGAFEQFESATRGHPIGGSGLCHFHPNGLHESPGQQGTAVVD